MLCMQKQDKCAHLFQLKIKGLNTNTKKNDYFPLASQSVVQFIICSQGGQSVKMVKSTSG